MEIFNNLCRACNTANPNLLSIFNNQQYDESVPLNMMLEYCLQTPIQNEVMYPNLICYFCVKQLEISYRFLQRYKLVQIEFEEAYKHMKETNKNLDADDKANCEDLEVREIEDKVCVLLPEYFQKTKKQMNESVKLNTTTENTEPQINIRVPTIKTEPKLSFLPAKTCSICNTTFFTIKARNLHLKLTHKRSRNDDNREHTDNDSKIEYMEGLKSIKIETTKSNLIVNNIEPVNNVKEAMDVSNNRAKECSICNKPFFTTKALNLHLKLTHKQNLTIN